ncbi:MULE transposase domain protein [Gigaspora margarita]|uniref:MULE transposase domain protein n=1 Tax=Gigaspora margarita TaxID=4874 RepID=A0A8H4A360_GIGMA|nr:MULE transposase domain protein [Gigaspora margarita]
MRYEQMRLGRIIPSWFDAFKRKWNQLASRQIALDAEKRYMIDLTRWVCSCTSFLNSRFLICKHLVHRAIEKEKTHNPEGVRLVYSNFRRCTDYPFLIWDGNNSQNQCLNIDTESSTQMDILKTNILVDDDSENFNPELYQDCKAKVAALGRLVEHLNNELSENNL